MSVSISWLLFNPSSTRCFLGKGERVASRDGPWPELTFDPQSIRGRPAFDPGTFRPDQTRFFLTQREKIQTFDIFRGNFPNLNPNHIGLIRPNPNHKKLTQPGSKKFDLDPSLVTRVSNRAPICRAVRLGPGGNRSRDQETPRKGPPGRASLPVKKTGKWDLKA